MNRWLHEGDHHESSLLSLADIFMLLLVMMLMDMPLAPALAGIDERLSIAPVAEETGAAVTTGGGAPDLLLVAEDGSITLNGRPVSLEQLAAALAAKPDAANPPRDAPAGAAAAGDAPRGTILAVDCNARYESGLAVRGALLKAGLPYVEVIRPQQAATGGENLGQPEPRAHVIR